LLCAPTDFKKLLESKGKTSFTIWEPIPPAEYVALGCVAHAGTTKPPTSLVWCVKKSLISESSAGSMIWSDKKYHNTKETAFWTIAPQKDTFRSNFFVGTTTNNKDFNKVPLNLISKGSVQKSSLPSQVEHFESVSKSLNNWIDNKAFSDTTFTVANKTLHAHSVFFLGRSKFESGETKIDTKYDYNTFLAVLTYLYTGKCTVNHNNVYSILSCADRYGVTSLRDACFDFLIWSVDKNSVCKMMMKGKNKEFEFDATSLIEKCIGYIENQAFEVVQSPEFLNLDLDLVVSIFKNEKIVCEEIELFNAALRWAKKHGGDPKVLLVPVMEWIRFPLMTSDDLLKIVKPSGQLSKERYMEAIEFVSLPKAFKDRKDPQFKYRFRIFHGSTVLDNIQSLQINEWIGLKKTQEWKLIYKATKDGFAANNFHQKCDGKTHTVTVIKSANGNIFGNYTPCAWSTNGSYVYDQSSFMFTLVNSLKTPLKFVHSGSNLNSIYCASGYGPTFGSGHDLHLCNNSNTQTGSYSNLGYSYPVTNPTGYAYGSNQVKNLFAGSYNFLTLEIEIYEKLH
jgi:hypothetical protein